MNINATILLDSLRELPIEKRFVTDDNTYCFHLKFPVLYEGEHLFRNDRVYIARAEDLSPTPAFRKQATILCVGIPGDPYWTESCNLICFSQVVSVAQLLNAAQEVFSRFDSWVFALQELLLANAPLKEFGNISLSIFQNPIAFHDRNHRSLFLCSDPYQEPLPQDAIMEDNSYMPLEELNLIMTDPEYNDLINHRDPTLLSDRLYNYKTLVQNIFLEDEFIGRVCIYNIYRPFRPSDYALLAFFSTTIKSALERYDLMREIKPRNLEKALSGLLQDRIFDSALFESALDESQWREDDVFLCAVFSDISSPFSIHTVDTTKEDRVPLDPIIQKNSCIFKHERYTVMLIDLSRSEIARSEVIRSLDVYFAHMQMHGGISIEFDKLRQLPTFFDQAVVACEKAVADSQFTCRPYDPYQLDFIIKTCLGSAVPDAFIPSGLFRLMQYDRDKGTDHCHLLQVYLENNMNVAQTIRLLYIHRSTFLYRIERIYEILGTDLSSYEDRMAFQFAFLILSNITRL